MTIYVGYKSSYSTKKGKLLFTIHEANAILEDTEKLIKACDSRSGEYIRKSAYTINSLECNKQITREQADILHDKLVDLTIGFEEMCECIKT